MMMKQLRVFVFLAFLIINMQACSQTRLAVKRTHAFYFVRLPGILQDNEVGKAPVQSDTTNVLFVETEPQDIVWQEAIINGKSFEIIAEKLNQAPVFVGNEKLSQQKVELLPSGSNYLWRLTFRPKKSNDIILHSNQFLIKGKAGNASFSVPIKIRKEIVLPEVNQ